jgi:hypothetical protein
VQILVASGSACDAYAVLERSNGCRRQLDRAAASPCMDRWLVPGAQRREHVVNVAVERMRKGPV